MARPDRSTATADAIAPADREDAWYLVLSQTGTGSEATSRVVPLADSVEVLFGRSQTSSVWIDHESVSRRHAVVRRKGSTVTVEDLGSRNGTLVNGSPIATPRRLSPGDEITVGPRSAP